MAWLTRRSEVLAQNIANSNTPGYKARDLQETSFRRLVARELGGAHGAARPRMTHPAHMSGTSGTQAAYRVEDESDVPEIDISGNTVSMEQQMQQLGETQLSYQMVVDRQPHCPGSGSNVKLIPTHHRTRWSLSYVIPQENGLAHTP